jgi:hypothetical protein
VHAFVAGRRGKAYFVRGRQFSGTEMADNEGCTIQPLSQRARLSPGPRFWLAVGLLVLLAGCARGDSDHRQGGFYGGVDSGITR